MERDLNTQPKNSHHLAWISPISHSAIICNQYSGDLGELTKKTIVVTDNIRLPLYPSATMTTWLRTCLALVLIER